MTISKFLQKIEGYKKPENLFDTHVPFIGSPQKHPYDPEKVILVNDPYGGLSSYYEFLISDVSFVEDVANIGTMDGEVVKMVRIWVKKKSVCLHCSPFLVDNVRG